ncbi:clusterin [Seriola lalandi dorsalis]|uniref:Clusterin n=1 Tax=Seriola lalandi dorsalis TaxID=1841481 RepID=A0A3B4Z364_SERLL|nr:clusterin [Seriola lalandi dorsalis]XP_056260880.1 clusterin [Seriola aureovittata]
MLMMMMMMMKKKGLKFLAVVTLFLASANCILLPSKEDLTHLSLQGEKYLDKQIENAINGVKEMKTVMQKSSEDHKKFLDSLEKTKQQKDEAMRTAQEMEAKLEQEEEVCNDTMRALWEECKPCLKNTCVRYYSRTCSSGSGLVGRQLEEVLNRTSPFSIWINGEKMDVLEREGQRQNREFRNLEEKYTEMADGVDSIFSDSMKVAEQVQFFPPIIIVPEILFEPLKHDPEQHTISVRSLFHNPFHRFQNLFSPMMGMGRNFFGSMGSMMDIDSDTFPNEDGSLNEDVVITKPFGNGRMTCREIRRNSAGCIKFRDECQKCKEIQHIDCSGRKPLESPLKQELEEALAMAERFTQQYNTELERFEEQMFNTSSILDLFNKQFGWVSYLANNTNSKDGIFRFQTVICRDTEEKPGEEQQPVETNVSVQLFDSPPMNFTVPGDIPWTDPKFSEVVAQEALDRYKETSVVVK